MSAIRVALVDDQPLFRAGIRQIVSSQPDLEFVGEAGDGATGVMMVEQTRPDVVLMDIRMPVLDGIEATRRILAPRTATARVVVLTTFALDTSTMRAIQAGASGFLLKDAQPEFLLASIRAVHAGNAVIAPAATRDLFEHFMEGAGTTPGAGIAEGGPRMPPSEVYRRLTAREREIFLLVASGLSNAEIAQAEFLSEATVKTHVSRILNKLELRDRVQLVLFAVTHGLLRPAAG
ncbi:response regulator transcription factor [Herbiconiux sp. CPCC 205763]|uniref:Response regulator transcription factor n=1 Tax=Herbiconiux aconitum TaxID=2970913 RepID=A0ABT2GPK3_9MICO|nr:response regulator transcription factor [Herbiconiux aconitum]MCS5718150.1 response regulator transcription factor [Herbiconiux aconitum]